MARRLNTLNFAYTAVGLAIAGGIGYYVWRNLRNRRLESGFGNEGTPGADTQGREENLMDLRRSTRRAGRAVKDPASPVGKADKRGAGDVAESFEDATSSGQALVTGDSYGSSKKPY
jgi:hypothetical protein